MDILLQWLQERLPGSSNYSQHWQQQQQQDQDMLLKDSLASKLANLPSLWPAQLLRPHALQQHILPMQTSPAAQAGPDPAACNVNTRSSSRSSNFASSAFSSSIRPKSCRNASQNSGSSWRQQLSRVADKLSCKVVLDSNSGSCAAELCWHVRTEQQPKMAVKLSNRHQTLISFDTQVALRPGPSKCPMLRLAGTPHGVHSASLLIKPLRSAPSPSTLLDRAPNADISPHRVPLASSSSSSSFSNQYSRNSSGGVGNETSTNARRSRRQHRQRQGVDDAATASAAPTAAHQLAPKLDEPNGQVKHRLQQQQQQQQQPAFDNAQTGRRQPAIADAAALQGAQGSSLATTAPTVAAAAAPLQQLQWEVGWNWKVGGPVAAVTKQLDTANSSSSNSSTARPLVVQQLKAAYDAKSCSYTLAAGGTGWSVNVVVPTQIKGFGGLVPRVWQAGCRPKVTVSLVPELTCF